VKTVTIGGVGSVLLGDDGVGPYVVRALEAGYQFEERVTVADLGTPGLDLIAHLTGVDALILIDSVNNGTPPGTITLYRREDILRHGPAPVRMDPHSPALSESLLIADLAGGNLEEVLLIGISGEQFEPGSSLSPAVRESVAPAIQEILKELDRIKVAYWDQPRTGSFSAWWEPLAMSV